MHTDSGILHDPYQPQACSMETHPRSVVLLALGLIALSAVSTTAQTGQFCITNVGHSNQAMTFQWESAAGWNYTVQRNISLASGLWSNVTSFADLPGMDGFLAATDTLQSASQAFYRIERYRPPYRHTITIDGVNDFTSDETFATSSSGYTAYLTWDNTYLYVGMQGSDIGANSPYKWVLVYVDGSPGTMSGLAYNTQQPQLPFAAKYHLRWCTDGYYNAMSSDGTSWNSLPPGSEGFCSRSGSFLEWQIPLATIGNPSQFDIHVSMLNDSSGFEWSYAGVPATSFVDSYNPNYTKYYHFDMTNSSVPNASSPIP
jgi:hypothetical protein